MRKSLQVFLGLFGLSALCIALLHIALGPAAIPGAVPVNATMDSEDRFYATLFGAYGVALLWCIEDIERKSHAINFLMAALFVGGLARLVSMAAVGLPHSFFMIMTALELLIPMIIIPLQSRIADATQGQTRPWRCSPNS